eukprot:UN24609
MWFLTQKNVKEVKLSAVEGFGHHVAKIGLYDLFNKDNQTLDWSKKVSNSMLDPTRTTKKTIETKADAEKYVIEAHHASHFAPTGKNPESSRGHIAFIIHILLSSEESEQSVNMLLVDLAGSEGESALSGDFAKMCSPATLTARRLEAGCINTGLSQLQVVFGELASRGTLTNTVGNGLRRILHPFINNQTYLSVIFCFSPSIMNATTTQSTLKFAAAACRIKTKPVAVKKRKNMKKIVDELKSQLNASEENNNELLEEVESLENEVLRKDEEISTLHECMTEVYHRIKQSYPKLHKIFKETGALDFVRGDIDAPPSEDVSVTVPKFTPRKSQVYSYRARSENLRETAQDLLKQLGKTMDEEESSDDEQMLVGLSIDEALHKTEMKKLEKVLADKDGYHRNRDERTVTQIFDEQIDTTRTVNLSQQKPTSMHPKLQPAESDHTADSEL